jgi:hypothetical protein
MRQEGINRGAAVLQSCSAAVGRGKAVKGWRENEELGMKNGENRG